MKFKEAVTYDDMLLVPQYSDITSRSEVDISSPLSVTTKLQLPIMARPKELLCLPAIRKTKGLRNILFLECQKMIVNRCLMLSTICGSLGELNCGIDVGQA